MNTDTGPDWWGDDDRLLAELAAAAREADSVPESVRRIGHAAWAWRTVDAELAQLQADSRTAGAQPVGLRAEPGSDPSSPRMLSFAGGSLSLELELDRDALRGQLIPPQAAAVRVRPADADEVGGVGEEVPVDAVGWFVLAPAPTGRFRLHVRTAAGEAVITDWIDP